MVQQLHWSPDSTRLLSLSTSGAIHVWRMQVHTQTGSVSPSPTLPSHPTPSLTLPLPFLPSTNRLSIHKACCCCCCCCCCSVYLLMQSSCLNSWVVAHKLEPLPRSKVVHVAWLDCRPMVRMTLYPSLTLNYSPCILPPLPSFVPPLFFILYSTYFFNICFHFPLLPSSLTFLCLPLLCFPLISSSSHSSLVFVFSLPPGHH